MAKRISQKTINQMTSPEIEPIENYDQFFGGIAQLLEEARQLAARSVNAIMTATYWEIGRRIVEWEQEGEERAIYGINLMERLAEDLKARFGRGFGKSNLFLMRSFYLSRKNIFQTLSGKSSEFNNINEISKPFPLSWSHYVELLSVENEKEREFYEEEALRGGWSIRHLRRQMNTLFYKRVLLSKNKAAMLEKGQVAKPEDTVTLEEAIKSPYILEFLNLKDEYSESELEDALIRHLETFLLELGGDFAFVGRQKLLRVDDTWFRIDLVFFHRGLRCLVLLDLKLDDLTPGDVGQMNFYCNYAKDQWMRPSENPPVGLILCARKGSSVARYALEGISNKILAAQYQTELPDTKLLEDELQRTRRILEERLTEGENV